MLIAADKQVALLPWGVTSTAVELPGWRRWDPVQDPSPHSYLGKLKEKKKLSQLSTRCCLITGRARIPYLTPGHQGRTWNWVHCHQWCLSLFLPMLRVQVGCFGVSSLQCHGNFRQIILGMSVLRGLRNTNALHLLWGPSRPGRKINREAKQILSALQADIHWT